jgi:DNA-binding transcriptional MerR regulator
MLSSWQVGEILGISIQQVRHLRNKGLLLDVRPGGYSRQKRGMYHPIEVERVRVAGVQRLLQPRRATNGEARGERVRISGAAQPDEVLQAVQRVEERVNQLWAWLTTPNDRPVDPIDPAF